MKTPPSSASRGAEEPRIGALAVGAAHRGRGAICRVMGRSGGQGMTRRDGNNEQVPVSAQKCITSDYCILVKTMVNKVPVNRWEAQEVPERPRNN